MIFNLTKHSYRNLKSVQIINEISNCNIFLLLFSALFLCQIHDLCYIIQTSTRFKSFVCIWLMISAECWFDWLRRLNKSHNQFETKDFDCWRKKNRWKSLIVTNWCQILRIWNFVFYFWFVILVVCLMTWYRSKWWWLLVLHMKNQIMF